MAETLTIDVVPVNDAPVVTAPALSLSQGESKIIALADLGVTAEHVSTLAPMAADDPSSPTNPIPLDAAVCGQLYNRAITGTLTV